MLDKISKKLKKGMGGPELIYPWLRGTLKAYTHYYLDPSGRSAYPSEVYICINNKCDMRCKMCDVGQRQECSSFYKNLMTPSEEQLTLDDFKKLIDDVAGFKPIIHINGTEPLLYKDLLEFIEYTGATGLSCGITTNGSRLHKLAERLVEAGTKKICVSIDGPPEVHDSIRGVPGTFNRAYNGLKKISEIKKETERKYPKQHIEYTISDYNYMCLEETVSLLQGLDLDNINFSLLDFRTNEMVKKHNQLYPEYPATETCTSGVSIESIDIKVLAEEIKKIKMKHTNVSFSPDLDPHELDLYHRKPEIFLRGRKCMVPWWATQINSNGDIVPFARCLNVVLGDIKKKSFKDIWNDEPYRAFRRALRCAKAFPGCTRCIGVNP